MNTAYLLIGGNEGDRRMNLEKAREKIAAAGCTIRTASALYETAAWGLREQPDFLNQALEISSPQDAPTLLTTLLDIEAQMGRKRIVKYGSRIIDIDIIFFNREIIRLPRLVIPHPEMQNRRFVLVPLESIAPDFVHPVSGKTIRELLKECPDTLDVKKINF